MRILEDSDGWILSLAGCIVTQCRVDYAFTILVQSEDNEIVTIRLEQPFQVMVSDHQWNLNAADDPIAVSPALAMLRQTVTSAHVSNGSVLILQFSNGLQVTAPPDPQGNYEGWTITSDYGARMVCMPGGELALWEDNV